MKSTVSVILSALRWLVILDVDILMVGDLNVDILKVGDLNVDILTVGNMDVYSHD
jgi:hypothetical protein